MQNEYIQNDILFSLKSIERFDQKEPQQPLSPAETAKSMDKLYCGNYQNSMNCNNGFYPQEESQKQFYIGAQIRQQIFLKKNEINQPSHMYSESNIQSLQNIENPQTQEQSQKKIKSNQQSLNSSNQYITNDLQSPQIGKNYLYIQQIIPSPLTYSEQNAKEQVSMWGNKFSNSQKRIHDNSVNNHLKILDMEMQEQNSSLFNSSEIKFNRFKRNSEDENQHLSRLQNSAMTGSLSTSKAMNDNLMQLDFNDSIIEKTEKRNIYKQMRVMNYVKIYINKMKSLSLLSNYHLMREEHFELIKDSTCYLFDIGFQKQNTKNQWKKLIIKLQQCFKRLPLINPENQWCIIWDILFGISLLFYFFIVPVEISFKVHFGFYHSYLIIVFLCNILLQFTKGFYKKGSLVMDQQQIIVNYIKSYFIIDIIIMINITSEFQIWVIYLKYSQLLEIIQRADDHFQIIRRFPIIYDLSNLIVTIVLIGQIAGCGFHLIAQRELESDSDASTWLKIMNLQDLEWTERYIASIYFAYITMITVGFGDIYPVTQNERVYVIFMTLCSSAIFGYVMNTIGTIFSNQAQKTASFKKRKQDITNFLSFRNINKQLQIKVIYLFQLIVQNFSLIIFYKILIIQQNFLGIHKIYMLTIY